MRLQVCVDVGGTFTDFVATDLHTGQVFNHKVPSTPATPHAAILTGIHHVLERSELSAESIVALLHGTTVGTNALIQRKVGKVAVVTTKGFRDLLEIGRQVRPKVYDMHLDYPPPLISRDLRFEVDERMRADGTVEVPLDEDGLHRIADELAVLGVQAVVVCFLHSYAYPDHEKRAVALLREAMPDDVHVVASAAVYPEFREYERFTTASLNGALLTVIDRYLHDLTTETQALGVAVTPRISQSSGGLMSIEMARRKPIRASLSGPAAGVSAVAHWAGVLGFGDIITLDVGGTSADVALIRNGQPSSVAVQEIGGFPVRLPAVDVSAVGAGGGTIAWIDTDGLLKVGPKSAGADPGPACYGMGGTEATVTDANVCLGRLNSSSLLGGRMPIDPALAEAAIEKLARTLNLPFRETALGILLVAAATVVKAMRKMSVERGYDPGDFTLFAFGGAGPLFAIEVAREIGLASVVVPPNPGLMCAEGLRHCSLMNDFVSTLLVPLEEADRIYRKHRAELAAEADAWFTREGVAPANRAYAWHVELRYRGQNFELSLPVEGDDSGSSGTNDLAARFHDAHAAAYGFASPNEPVELVSVKLKAAELVSDMPTAPPTDTTPATPVGSRPVVFDDREAVETPVFLREELARRQVIDGPCVIEQQDATSLIYPGDRAEVDDWGNLRIELGGAQA